MLALATLWDDPSDPHPSARSSEPSPFAAVPAEPSVDPLPPPPIPEEEAAEPEPPGTRRRKRQKTTLSSAFEEHLREGAQGFNFDALISTQNRPEPRPQEPEPKEAVVATSAPPTPPTPTKVRFWRVVLALGSVFAFLVRCVGKIFGGIWDLLAGSLGVARRGRRAVMQLAMIALVGLALLGGIKAYARWSTTGRIGNVVLGANPSALRSLPDLSLTPGEQRGNGERGEIDVSVRQAMMESYGIDPHDEGYVPVRLIPSEFGGINSAKNVFPAAPFYAQWKARVDAHLVELVSRGTLKKDQAIAELKIDWILAAKKYHVPDSVEIRLSRAKSN